MRLVKIALVFSCAVMALNSCTTTKKIAYLKDVEQKEVMDIVRVNVPKIVPNDILSIKVSSSNPQLAVPFNTDPIGSYNKQMQERQVDGYVVGSDGKVNFPILGAVQAAGMTREEFVESLQSKLKAYIPDPVVIANFVNFKVMVMGEVMRPGPVAVLSDRITILEAIAMAGDLSVYGKRDNILVVREQDGKRTMERVNIQSKTIFNSPYFYLQQNDIVYVEPVKAKAEQSSSFRSNLPLFVSAGSLLSSLILMIVTVSSK